MDFRERMRINGDMIPEERVTDFIRRFREAGYDGKPSFFELTMMMAFDWFAAENVDIAVVETGMGGRLDSTNIITPLMSVITNISNDHKQFLGDTLAQIASEKAGIIKNGIPVVIGEAEGEVESVFRRKAEETGAPLREAYRETDTEANSRLATPLSGLYQKKNVNTARVALEELRRTGVEISDECMIRGFARVIDNTHLAGRWMKLEENPTVICDTGHNEAGIMSNVRQLNDMRAEIRGRLHVVIGLSPTKTSTIYWVCSATSRLTPYSTSRRRRCPAPWSVTNCSNASAMPIRHSPPDCATHRPRHTPWPESKPHPTTSYSSAAQHSWWPTSSPPGPITRNKNPKTDREERAGEIARP